MSNLVCNVHIHRKWDLCFIYITYKDSPPASSLQWRAQSEDLLWCHYSIWASVYCRDPVNVNLKKDYYMGGLPTVHFCESLPTFPSLKPCKMRRSSPVACSSSVGIPEKLYGRGFHRNKIVRLKSENHFHSDLARVRSVRFTDGLSVYLNASNTARRHWAPPPTPACCRPLSGCWHQTHRRLPEEVGLSKALPRMIVPVTFIICPKHCSRI